jgi:tetratricopeptide (TPR) repeat protein
MRDGALGHRYDPVPTTLADPARAGAAEGGGDAVRQAQALSPTERERLYIATAEACYRDPESTDYWERIRRWEAATEALYQRFPDNHDAATLYALAHLAVAQVGESSPEHHARAADILGVGIRGESRPSRLDPLHDPCHRHARTRARVPRRRARLRQYRAAHSARAAHANAHLHAYRRLEPGHRVEPAGRRCGIGASSRGSGPVRLGRIPHAIEYLVYAYLQQGAPLEFTTPKHPVTPAPTLPAEELLGDLHMESGKPEEALAAYRRSLELHPNRLNSLIGAARAALALGAQGRSAQISYAAWCR